MRAAEAPSFLASQWCLRVYFGHRLCFERWKFRGRSSNSTKSWTQRASPIRQQFLRRWHQPKTLAARKNWEQEIKLELDTGQAREICLREFVGADRDLQTQRWCPSWPRVVFRTFDHQGRWCGIHASVWCNMDFPSKKVIFDDATPARDRGPSHPGPETQFLRIVWGQHGGSVTAATLSAQIPKSAKQPKTHDAHSDTSLLASHHRLGTWGSKLANTKIRRLTQALSTSDSLSPKMSDETQGEEKRPGTMIKHASLPNLTVILHTRRAAIFASSIVFILGGLKI